MNSRPMIAQEWSLHAELTFSHHQPVTSAPMLVESRRQDGSGIRMEYSWNSQPQHPTTTTTTTTSHTLHPCYGFQRGNILFTTTPPSQLSQTASIPQQLTAHQAHPRHTTPGSYSSLPSRRSQPQYNRRCKSTCSIVLSGLNTTTLDKTMVGEETNESPVTKCYHSLSHRCSDPVCYHSTTLSDDVPSGYPQVGTCGFSPVPESCEVCGGGRSPTAVRRAAHANTFTTHFCTRVPERSVGMTVVDKETVFTSKNSCDVASQTSDLAATSDGWQLTSTGWKTNPASTHSMADNKVRQKLEPDLLQLPSIRPLETSGNKRKPGKRLTRSPARLRGKSPLLRGQRSQGSQCSVVDGKASSPDTDSSVPSQRKPRTVHIDVYCTGSEEADVNTTSDSETEDGDSWSSPQTVFESDKLRVVHTRAGKNQLPQALQHPETNKKSHIQSRKSESFKYDSSCLVKEEQPQRGYDSDDGLSSQYPSKQSSYTTLQDGESTLISDVVETSRDPSWSTISSSSCALFSDEYDSAAATSCKDTATELESLMQSNPSLAQSDSFEYADAMDRLRIREKERTWAGVGNGVTREHSKTWQSPHMERKHLLQQQKFKEFLQKHLGKTAFPLWKPEPLEDSEEEDEDETGYAWSFSGGDISPKPGTVKREGTIRKAVVTPSNSCPQNKTMLLSRPTVHVPCDPGSLSDSGPPPVHRLAHRVVCGPFGPKSPSPPPVKLQSIVTLPFTTLFGKRTDQLSKAQKFGTIVGAFRKPGHHIGPSKNPECTCEHCRKYYEDTVYRNRTRSVGDMPLEKENTWKDSFEQLSNTDGGSGLNCKTFSLQE